MRIDSIVIPVAIQNKLISKHGVTVEETRFVLLTQPRIRFAEKGHRENNMAENKKSSISQASSYEEIGRETLITLWLQEKVQKLLPSSKILRGVTRF